ncbi:MAG TPA: VWA domain-containing protein [Vicinamibacterales bacterium]|nr:VWA domain-containing protein [Vicinamibacterales bacterium]
MSRTLAIVLLTGLQLSASGQEPQRFRARTDLVSVDVLVTDERQPVLGLTAGDFELIDNGVPQAIEQIYVEQLPVNVVMVLDTSGSVIGERLQALKAGAGSVIDKLRPRDRAAILSFSHRLDMPSPLTGDREALRKALHALDALGSTSLRDAAYAGLALRGADTARTLLLLFSDGLDTSSILSESRLMAVARRSDAIVYAIGVREMPRLIRGPVFTPNEAMTDDRFLSALARETGGRFFHAEQHRDIERTFTRVFEEFNSRYVLGYTPRGVAQPGWHKLEVRLKARRGDVLARRGYFGTY